MGILRIDGENQKPWTLLVILFVEFVLLIDHGKRMARICKLLMKPNTLSESQERSSTSQSLRSKSSWLVVEGVFKCVTSINYPLNDTYALSGLVGNSS
jgi:hypothetical protein